MLDASNLISILVVEDDEIFRTRLARAIRERGHPTIEAGGVAQALNAIDSSDLLAAVVDLRLQDGNGLQVVEALRRRHPEARVLILTGYGDLPTAVAATRLGAVDYLAKPEGADEILAALLTPRGQRPPPPADPITPDEARQAHIEAVYQKTGENVSQTARLLNMHRRTLQRILKRNGARTDGAA